VQDFSVEEQQSAECLILHRRGDALFGGQPSEKRFDLVFSHLQRVTFSKKEDKALDPGDIGSFRFEAVVLETDLFSDLIWKLFPGGGSAWFSPYRYKLLFVILTGYEAIS
jgi:hypothetical protein